MKESLKKTFSSFGFNFEKKYGALKFPKTFQLRQFFKALEKKEKIVFLSLLFLFLFSAAFLSLNFYFKNTELQPAYGGTYTEGLIGQPKFINPIYASVNDVDRDLTEIIFSGLMKYSPNGEIVPDLAKEYEIREAGKVYELALREGVFWHDGQPFSADDVIFTVKIIQDPNYNSPLRALLFGVEVDRIDNFRVRFRLKNPYAPFLETLTFKVLPKHIWQDVDNFILSPYKLNPVGTGPFKFKELKKDDKTGYIYSLELVRNPDYFGKSSYLSEISFRFFENGEGLLKALKNGAVNGLSYISPQDIETVKDKGLELYLFSFARYFDISFNPEKSKLFEEKEIRQALSYGTDKKAILEQVFGGYGKTVDSLFISEIYNLPFEKIYQFNPEKAKEILEKAGWKDQDGDGKREKYIKTEVETLFKEDLEKGDKGENVKALQACLAKDPQIFPEGEITGYFGEQTEQAVIRFQEKYSEEILSPWGFKKGTGLVSKNTRSKLNEVCSEESPPTFPLKFSLLTFNQTELSLMADLIKKQWGNLGVEVEIKKIPPATSSLNLEEDFIKPRNYEAILAGKAMTLTPDPYPFWHSSQRRDPGLNLALYTNQEADKLLEEARQTLNEEERSEKYKKLQEIIAEDAPVVFLCSPDYLYLVSKKIQGIDAKIVVEPSKRFVNIEEWYIKTKRKWK